MDTNIEKHLTAHVHSLVLSPSTIGLLDVPEEQAHTYLDLLIQMLFETLADADPWRELYGMNDTTLDGDRFGYPEAFSDIIGGGPIIDALETFGPVKRDAVTLEEKNRLVAWLSLRRRIILAWGAMLADDTVDLAQYALDTTVGNDLVLSYQKFVLLHELPDDAYFIIRNGIHGE